MPVLKDRKPRLVRGGKPHPWQQKGPKGYRTPNAMETRQCAAELSKGPDRAAVVQRDEGVPSVERHNLKVHVAKALGVHKTLLRCWDAGPSRTGIGWSDKGKEEF